MTRGRWPAIFTMALAATAALYAKPVRAHDLQENTAHISLRDGHAVVRARLDLVRWIDRLADTPRALEAGALSPAQLAALSASVRRELQANATLELDGQTVRLRVVGFPSNEAIAKGAVMSLVGRQIDHHAHGPRHEVQLEAERAVTATQQIELTFPPALGPVLVTFVEPQTQRLGAGQTARFSTKLASKAESRVPAASARPSESEESGGRSWLPAAVAFALGAAGSIVVRRR